MKTRVWLSALAIAAGIGSSALAEVKGTVTPKVVWQVAIGKANPGLEPVVLRDAIYAASTNGSSAPLVLANRATVDVDCA